MSSQSRTVNVSKPKRDITVPVFVAFGQIGWLHLVRVALLCLIAPCTQPGFFLGVGFLCFFDHLNGKVHYITHLY